MPRNILGRVHTPTLPVGRTWGAVHVCQRKCIPARLGHGRSWKDKPLEWSKNGCIKGATSEWKVEGLYNLKPFCSMDDMNGYEWWKDMESESPQWSEVDLRLLDWHKRGRWCTTKIHILFWQTHVGLQHKIWRLHILEKNVGRSMQPQSHHPRRLSGCLRGSTNPIKKYWTISAQAVTLRNNSEFSWVSVIHSHPAFGHRASVVLNYNRSHSTFLLGLQLRAKNNLVWDRYSHGHG